MSVDRYAFGTNPKIDLPLIRIAIQSTSWMRRTAFDCGHVEAWAIEMLVAGFDSQLLRELTGATTIDLFRADKMFLRALASDTDTDASLTGKDIETPLIKVFFDDLISPEETLAIGCDLVMYHSSPTKIDWMWADYELLEPAFDGIRTNPKPESSKDFRQRLMKICSRAYA